jgi:ABC-type Fe3+ transport system permease subunit
MKQKLRAFTKKIGSGLKQEYQETKDISKHIKEGNYKEASQQVADIGKMVFIVFIWILPAGAVMSGFIMKFSNKLRPTAFQEEEPDANNENKG